MMANIETGAAPRPDQFASCESEALGRGLVTQTAVMVDPDADVAKAQAAFDTLPIELSTPKLLCSLASSLVDLSAVFDPRHANEADKQLFLLDLALETLEDPLRSDDAAVRKRAEQIKKRAAEARSKVS
jgi:hypothetical protein